MLFSGFFLILSLFLQKNQNLTCKFKIRPHNTQHISFAFCFQVGFSRKLASKLLIEKNQLIIMDNYQQRLFNVKMKQQL